MICADFEPRSASQHYALYCHKLSEKSLRWFSKRFSRLLETQRMILYCPTQKANSSILIKVVN